MVPLKEETGPLLPGLVGAVEDPAVSDRAWVDGVAEGDALRHRDAEPATALVHATGHHGSMAT